MMNERKTKATLLVLGLTLPLLAMGCARKSAIETDADEAALDSARQAQAETYAPAATHVADGTQAADLESEVAAQKERDHATSMLADLRTSLEGARAMLDNAPTGKGSGADLAALKGDLGAVDVAVTDIERAISAERFPYAIQKAQAAMEKTDEIRAEIERAAEAQSAAKSRRGSAIAG